ncbi:hypothetical protein [uncultured Algimonas sp.]|uniref:hypothetical protein n=1 Tax=uncultured Algimonas sp. TaxID=1547920 RepID=UPI0026055934|nr:hypothetical protein [uncultured Algimonas sp.]
MTGLRVFRIATAWVTFALVAFVLWISSGAMPGRIIAAGVLLFGLGQWFVLGRLGHQMAAKDATRLERTDASG